MRIEGIINWIYPIHIHIVGREGKFFNPSGQGRSMVWSENVQPTRSWATRDSPRVWSPLKDSLRSYSPLRETPREYFECLEDTDCQEHFFLLKNAQKNKKSENDNNFLEWIKKFARTIENFLMFFAL